MNPRLIFVLLWLAWAISWIVAAVWSGRTEARLPWAKAWTYRLLLTAGTLMVLYQRHETHHRLWHVGYTGAYLLAALTACGLAFTWWARIWLGSLWSSGVTRKENHQVIDTGPYALVRHPIYTGILGAALATTIAKATLLGLAGFALMATGLWTKARFEETFLSEQLGQNAYAAYRRRVPMLVPLPLRRGS